jgi:hypothetical protein
MVAEVGSGRRSPPLAELQRFFLGRLDRLVALQGMARPGSDAERLLPRAIYSTYADRVSLGVGAQARERIARG